MNEPPKILQWLLDRFCPESRPDLRGDFLELYEARARERGRPFANRTLVYDIVSIIRLKFIIHEDQIKPVRMFKSNLKIARRILVKNRLYTTINIVGLSVSLAICILIALFIKDEFSFDKHFQEGDKVYRIAGNYSQGGADRVTSAQTSYLVKSMIEKDIDGLEAITRADFTGDIVTVNETKQYLERAMAFADSTFFDVFRIPFLKGDVATALDRPDNVVLDQGTAIKYFGTDDVLGKTIDLRGKQFMISGVFESLPQNTHFECNLVFPISGIKQWYPDWVLTNASGTSLYTYMRVIDNFNVSGFESAASKQVAAHWGWEGSSAPKYFLQPLRSIHLESNLQSEVRVNGSKSTIYIFALSAIVIFVLACINYINLTTAASFHRSKEVGMKKVLGSTTRMQLAQFQTESFLVAIIAIALSAVLARLAIPEFNELSGKSLDFNPFTDPMIGVGLFSVLILIGAVAGASPAFVLLRTSTMGMLRDKLSFRGSKSYLRSGLIVFQFSISIALITCTLIVMDQISFIRKSDLGIDPESVVLIPLATTDIASKSELMKTELMRNPSVVSVSASSNKVTERVGGWRQYKLDPAQKDVINCPSTAVSYDFFETMKATMVEGRTFSKAHATDVYSGYILNESAVKFFGLDNPVGKDLQGSAFNGSEWFTRNGQVIGVVKDFHFASLHDKVEPVVFYLASEQTETYNWLEVRVQSDKMSETIQALKGVWTNIAGDRPFEFEFMDEAVAYHYQAEDRFLKVFTIFSVLSIMLGGLGLFGLTAFTAKRRTKEIGIHRVMGASTGILIKILSFDFLKLILIANIIGWPIAYYFMNRWMTNFAYHTTVSVWAFIGTGIAVFLIAFLCLLYHSLKVSSINPVRSLKTE
jgi:putative ABC transport system permease protein